MGGYGWGVQSETIRSAAMQPQMVGQGAAGGGVMTVEGHCGDETVRQWQQRKWKQGFRICERVPGTSIDDFGDYRTKFVAVNQEKKVAIVFGQLPWDGNDRASVDLTDDEVVKLFAQNDGRNS